MNAIGLRSAIDKLFLIKLPSELINMIFNFGWNRDAHQFAPSLLACADFSIEPRENRLLAFQNGQMLFKFIPM